MLSLLRHKNIVTFYGISFKPIDYFYIITEFVEGGSLAEFIHNSLNIITMKQKISIIYQICCACFFLVYQIIYLLFIFKNY